MGEHKDREVATLGQLVIRISVFIIILILLFGCASKRTQELDTLQQAVQDCILQGGHPHLGPADTIICQ